MHLGGARWTWRYGRDVEVHVEQAGSGNRWRVEVRTGGRRSEHTVTVPVEVLRDLGYGPEEAEALLRASFEFLLERERPSSILGEFSIEQITHYFGDYPEAVRRSR